MNEVLQQLGKSLEEQRNAKGMTMAQLASRTKISENFIESMENGDFSFLPGVYIRAFMRSIAREIGLDADVLVKQYTKAVTPVPELEIPAPASPAITQTPVRESKKIAPEPAREGSASRPFWQTPFFIFSFLALLIFSVVLIVLPRKQQLPPDVNTGISITPVDSTAQQDSSLILIPEENKPQQARPLLTLTVKANDIAWLRIVYNDSMVDEGTFAAGDSRSWTSRGSFYLKIGNAGGIRLILNDRDLGSPGQEDKVANIKVDQNGISNISYGEFPPIMGGGKQ